MSTYGADPGAPDDPQARVLEALLGMQRQSWEQGVASHALLDLGLDSLVEVMARDAVTRQTAAGKLAEIEDGGIVNSAANGEAVRWAAGRSGNARLADAFDRQLRWITHDAPRAGDGTLFHIEGTREVWVDTVYMVVPFLVLAGELTQAAAQLAGHRARLFDESAGLYAARWDEDTRRLTSGAFWGTGNGWSSPESRGRCGCWADATTRSGPRRPLTRERSSMRAWRTGTRTGCSTTSSPTPARSARRTSPRCSRTPS